MIERGWTARTAGATRKLWPVLLASLAFSLPTYRTATAAPTSEPGTALTLDAADALRRDGRAVLWVYFTDKGETDAASLERAVAGAGARVSTASRTRRSRLTGGTFIPDYTDVPSLPRYVQSVEFAGARVRHVSRWLNAVSVEVDEAGARRIAALPFVRRTAPVMRVEAQLAPPGSYGVSLTQNLGINAVAAHDSGYSAAGVVVAIFDTGFRKDHAALAPLKRIAEWDFVQSDGETANQAGEDATQWNHGTGVWSILGGYSPGSLVGPAFNASFVLAKTKYVGSTGTVDEDRWVAAAQWADSIGIDIVSSSMVVSYPVASLDGATTPMALATNILTRHGVLVVTAMGNSGPGPSTLWTPSDCDSILAVGSVTSSNVISSFSSRGPTADGRGKPDLVAQGENTIWAIPSCVDCLGTYPGTSLATPLVSGAAALVQEAHPEWSSQQVRYALKSTADKAGAADSTTYGWGRPNIVSAIYNSTLGGPVYPKPFALVAPPNGTTNATLPVAFRWRRSVDLNPGDAVSYTLRLAKVSPASVVFTTSTPDTFFSYSGPLDPGDYEWDVVATDLGGNARPGHEVFRFTTSGAFDQAPAATAPATAGGPENALLSFGVTAADPDGDAISALTAAPLPAGATFVANGANTAGTFSWTPGFTQSGTYNVTFTASNALSGAATTGITVTNVNRAPVFSPIAPLTVLAGGTATRALAASDPDGDAVTFSKLSGPAFTSVTGSTLTASPAAADTGAYTAVVRATDGSLAADQPASVTVTTQPPPPGGLVASYPLAEGSGTTTADASGSGYTGTLTNGPLWVAGKYGNALSFNATDDNNDSNDPKVVLGRTINIPNLPFTFSAWVNPASYADWRAIFSKRDSPSASNMRCDVGLAKGSGRVYVATGSTTRTFTYSAPVNVWTHLAVVAEAGGTKLYVNGNLQQTLAAITLGTGTNANTAIGGTGTGPTGDNDPFKGLLDDLRLYNRALTQAEIQADMNTPAGAPDTEPPTVALTAPPAGTVSGSAVTVSAGSSDNVGVVGVQFQLDGVNLNAEDTTAPYSIVWNTLTASDGSHTLTAVARDAAGNSATSAGVVVTVSNPPTLAITQPAGGSSLVGTTVNVAYTTSGNLTGVDHVHFVLDTNPEVMDVDFDGSYQFTSVPAGTHVLNAFLVDAGHVKIPGTDAAPVSFTNTVPTLTITQPAEGSTLSGTTTVNVAYTVTGDLTGVGHVHFRLDGNPIVMDLTMDGSYQLTNVAGGAHVLNAFLVTASHVKIPGTDATPVNFTTTLPPPTLTITQPANGSTQSGTTVNVAYTVTGDLTGVDHVHFQLDSDPIVMDLTLDGSYQLVNVLGGAHVLNAFLVDAGHVKVPGTDAAPVTFTTTAPDTTPPTVAVTAPAASSTVSGTITVTGDAADDTGVVGVQFRVDAANLGPEDTSAPFSASFNTTTVANGSHVLTAIARDAAGNQTTSDGVSITVSNVVTGLVAAYALDEGSGTITADASGSGYTGTLTNAPVWVAGKYGNALSFNATDDGNDSNDPKVVLGRTINVPNLPFTFSAWVNPASYADWRAIFSKRDSPSASNMRCDIGLASGTGRVYVATGSTTRTFTYGPPLNSWTHLTVVAEAGGTKLYVNGTLQQTLAAITLGTGTNANTAIGGTGTGPTGDNDPFKGLLDDLRLYNRALTQTEIQADMNTPAGAPDTEPPTVAVTAPPAGTVSGSAVTVSATASDNVVVAGVRFKLDGTDLGAEDTTAPYSIVWNTLTTSDGSHTLTAVARDAAGNSATSAGVVVTVSNPPTLAITQPAGGSSIVGTTVNVAYTTSGNLTGVDHVHFQLDSNPIVMDVTLDGSHQFTNVPAGAHVLDAFLVNEDHVKIPGTDAPTVNFTTTVADTIPPTVSITSPAEASTVSATVTITADAADNTGVLGVQFRVGTVDIIPEDTSAPFSVSFNTTTFPNGPYVLTAVARDAAGNQTVSSGVPITVSNLNPNDPAVVGQWSAPFTWPNVAVHLTIMSDGNFLTWDDHTSDGGAHVWNPTTNVFTPVTYNPANLFCSGHTALPDGRILVNGGHVAAYVGITGTVLFTPSTRTWTPVAPMTYARWYPTTITLPDGRVLTVSGAINCPDCRLPGGPDPGIAEIPEIYDPETNSWASLNSAPLNLPIYPHLFVLPDGRVISTSTQEDPTATYVLDLNTQTWTTVDPAIVDGGSTVMYLPGKFMKSGAAINPDYPALPANALTHVLDMTSGPTTWRQTAPMAFPRTQHNLTILPDGNVLVTGGGRNSSVFDQSSAVFEAELWSPSTETYTTLSGNQTPRLYHSTALLLPDGRVISAGGGRFGPNQLSGEFYSPPYLFKGPRPTITAAPSLIEYGSSFTVDTPDAGRIATVSLVRLGSVTHAINFDQRFVPLTFGPASGGLAVQAPTSPNLAPPGYYYLFLVDTNGVPSVASVVRFPSPAEDAVPPTPPTNLAATGSVGAASLAWTASTDNIGVAAYDVHRSASAGFTPSPATKVGATSGTSYVDTGIPAGTYYYQVQARDAVGNASSPSNEATATVAPDSEPPSAPLGLTAIVRSSSLIDLTWSPSTDNVRVAGYRVHRDGALIATPTLPSYSDPGVVASTTYTYTVTAVDGAGNVSAPSAPVPATTPAAPPPSIVAAYAFDEGSGTTTADLSGHDNTGTLTNGPVWTVGKYGNALSFNATDDGNDANDPRVVLGRNVKVPNLPFTFSAWVNPAGFADWRAIFSKRDSPSASNMRLDVGLSSGTGRVYVATGATFRSFLYNPPLNAWTHLAVVAEAGGTKLYVNGNLQQTLTAITLGADTLANTVIGGTGEPSNGDNDPFKGLVDDLRLYDRAQTQAEIQTDMNTPAGGPPPGAFAEPLAASAAETGASPPAPAVLRVFPNPFRGTTRIEATGGEGIAVYDVSGRRVRSWRPFAAPTLRLLEWDGTDHRGRHLPTGIYFVKSGRQIVRVALLR